MKYGESPSAIWCYKKLKEEGWCCLKFIVGENFGILNRWTGNSVPGTFTFVTTKRASVIDYIVMELPYSYEMYGKNY